MEELSACVEEPERLDDCEPEPAWDAVGVTDCDGVSEAEGLELRLPVCEGVCVTDGLEVKLGDTVPLGVDDALGVAVGEAEQDCDWDTA